MLELFLLYLKLDRQEELPRCQGFLWHMRSIGAKLTYCEQVCERGRSFVSPVGQKPALSLTFFFVTIPEATVRSAPLNICLVYYGIQPRLIAGVS